MLWQIPGVGQIGNYESVYEIDFGFEGYRSRQGAAPHLGNIGERVLLGKAAVVTYVARDCGQDILDRLVVDVAKVHPWEHPVIEFTECLLNIPIT